jgi:hypothetical protein
MERWFPQVGCILDFFAIEFLICAKKKKIKELKYNI